MIKKIIFFISLLLLFTMPSFLNAGGILTKEQVKIVAENYIKFEKHNFPTWENTSIKKLLPLYSSNNILLGYEASIVNKEGNDKGFLIIDIDTNNNVIATFSEDGESISKNLMKYYNNNLKKVFIDKKLIVKEIRILANIPTFFALGIKFEKENIDKQGFILQNGWYIFSPPNIPDPLLYTAEVKKNTRKYNTVNTKDNNLLDVLLQGNETSKLFITESSGAINNIKKNTRNLASSNYSSAFSHFYQEKRKWTQGGTLSNGQMCLANAGCSPIAWVTLLEYWDRNGYPNLISSSSDNNNRSTTDPDIRWSVNELRGYLKTNCYGKTFYYNNGNGEYFIAQRGYNAIVSNNYFGFDWDEIVYEINNNRPIIVHIDSSRKKGRSDHSCVAYKYTNNPYISNDKFKVNLGWGNRYDQWYYRKNLYGATSVDIE